MKRKSILAIGGLLACPVPSAIAAFNPDAADVCVPQAGGQQVVDKNRLLQHLLKEHGIFPIDIDKTGGFSNDRVEAAITSPDEFCDVENTKKCSEKTATALGAASIDLYAFFNRGLRSVPPGETGFRVDNPPLPEERTLGGYMKPAVTVSCFVAVKKPSTEDVAKAEDKVDKTPQRFMVRASVDDLATDQSDDDFKKLGRAQISVNKDLLTHSHAIGIEGVVGWGLGRAPLAGSENQFWEAILFAGYKRQYVDGPNPAGTKNINNITFGVVGDVLLYEGIHHDFQFTPKIVHAFKSSSDIFSGTLTYTPMPSWSGVGTIAVFDKTLGFQVKPQGRLVYGHVVDDGGNPSLRDDKDFGRGGGRIEASLTGWDGSIFENAGITASYEYLRVFKGPLDSVHRFESAFTYGLAKSLVGLQVKYAEGHDLDTLEKERKLTLGVGLKY